MATFKRNRWQLSLEYPNILAVNASLDVRWKRVIDKYQGDFNQFKEDDERDQDEDLKWGQNVQKSVDLADIYITNEKNRRTKSDWEEFEKKLHSYIKIIEEPGSRSPTTRELLMNNAYHTSLLSDCMKRQVGAIIAIPRLTGKHEGEVIQAKEDVVASGYNAVPEKQQCCEEKFGQCYRDMQREEFLKK